MQDYVKLWTALKWYLWRHIEIFQLMQIHLNFSNSQNEHYAINLLKTKFIHHFQLFLLHWERCISYFPLISIFDCLVADSMIFRPCTTNYKLIRPIYVINCLQHRYGQQGNKVLIAYLSPVIPMKMHCPSVPVYGS